MTQPMLAAEGLWRILWPVPRTSGEAGGPHRRFLARRYCSVTGKLFAGPTGRSSYVLVSKVKAYCS